MQMNEEYRKHANETGISGILILLAVFAFLFVFPQRVNAGILFQSSWDYATGSCGDEGDPEQIICNDGGKWVGGYENQDTSQGELNVQPGGPGGHNYLNMRTVGEGGWGQSSGYRNWEIAGGVGSGDVLRNPDNLYIRLYFRVHEDWDDDGTTHWFMGEANRDHYGTGHYLNIRDRNYSDAFPDLVTEFNVEIEKYGSGTFEANVSMQRERWYCWEIYVKKIDPERERWYIRLDGVDITDKFKAISGSSGTPGRTGETGIYRKWLVDLYNTYDWAFVRMYHGNIWMATYDQLTLNSGWDVTLVEVRDDRWPGPIVEGPDTEPPTGTVQITGAEGRTDRTASTAVTLTLNATDNASGVTEMQFSNSGTSWSTAEPYKTSKTWTLIDTPSETEANRTVYVKFKDGAGNWSNPINDSIILDKDPPLAPAGEAPLWN
ncbi:MAG: hypothetical protein Kow0099_26610 [Candidatus Abyssubacteria bacterium]